MIDKKQTGHFKIKKNRYDEHLLSSPPQHVIYETQELIKELKKENVCTVVDFGSGNGRLSIPLLQAGFTVYSVDISKTSLKRLTMVAKRMGCDKKLTTSIHLPHKPVDAVVGADILHHTYIDDELKNIKKILKKKGRILFSEPNILNPAWVIFISFFLNWKIEKRVIFCNYFSLQKVFRNNSFSAIHIYGHGLVPPPFFNKVPLLQKINYRLGDFPFLKLFAYRYFISASL